MASGIYNRYKAEIGNGTADYLTDVVRVMLVKSGFSFNPDNDFVSDISANEVGVAGYSRQTLGSKTVAIDDPNDRAVYDGADTAHGNLATGETVVGAVLYRQTGGSDASPGDDTLMAYLEFSAGVPTNGGSFGVTWNAVGIFTN